MRGERAPLVLDASAAFDPDEQASSAALVEALLEPPRVCAMAVRLRGHGMVGCDPARLSKGNSSDEDLWRWLAGQGSHPAKPLRRSSAFRGGGSRTTPRAVPAGAVVLKPGWSGWDDPAWERWARAHPKRGIVALLDTPLALEWPEYVSAAAVAATPGRLDAVARLAGAIIVPDSTTRTALEPHVRARTSKPDIVVLGPPSPLEAPDQFIGPLDRLVGPFFLIVDRIEARANTTLLLQVWRELIGAGGSVPKLVLAGARGRQVEEIRPLLEWNEAIAAAVVEAPALGAASIRRLAVAAQAVIAPAFTGGSGALLRDLKELGVPIIASDTPAHAEAIGRAGLLSPLDGRGFRHAVTRALTCERSSRGRWLPARRPDYLNRIEDLASSL